VAYIGDMKGVFGITVVAVILFTRKGFFNAVINSGVFYYFQGTKNIVKSALRRKGSSRQLPGGQVAAFQFLNDKGVFRKKHKKGICGG
jgi:hypothetical protein